MTDNVNTTDTTVLTSDNKSSDASLVNQETVDKTKEDAAKAAASAGKDGEANKDKDNSVDKSKQGAPETYADFKIPEGMELDKGLLEKSIPVLKELNLSQEQAQKLVDLQTQFSTKYAENAAKAWKDTVDKWVGDAKSDKEFGGAKFNDSIVVAKDAINKFGGPGFKEMLDFTGIGNHPEMIRFLVKVGNLAKEDGIFHGSNSGGGKDPAKIMFPGMN